MTVHDIEIEGSYNARGIGDRYRPWMIRTAALDPLAPGGERALRALGVDLVIDLREPSECGPRAHALPIHSIPLYAADPPSTGSLEAVYAHLVQERGPRLAEAVTAIAEHPGTAVVHCTAGKDRTGLVIALARLAAGDAREEVLSDYARSGATVRAARATLVAERLDWLGLDDPARHGERSSAERLHLDSPGEALAGALTLVDAIGGDAAGYLRGQGMTAEHLAALSARRNESRTASSGARATSAVTA